MLGLRRKKCRDSGAKQRDIQAVPSMPPLTITGNPPEWNLELSQSSTSNQDTIASGCNNT
ncbi:hypothetical protein [Pseudomonas protegens]|uniref:hypothetical protein n=1 Tax=Pseudomonas protegens TaxID=380021 RepID=UPI000E1E3EAD|nr:hypothetical protein [Pseudomonas protegens]AXK57103.1 hypothetical protein DWF74_28480 [Pseudomonas protegens]MCL9657793.1 DUF2599 domain-containing protein [Pseudomonas protegens]BCT32928.1 hypothetical protein PproGo58_24230 [Pseudomonas protegens]